MDPSKFNTGQNHFLYLCVSIKLVYLANNPLKWTLLRQEMRQNPREKPCRRKVCVVEDKVSILVDRVAFAFWWTLLLCESRNIKVLCYSKLELVYSSVLIGVGGHVDKKWNWKERIVKMRRISYCFICEHITRHVSWAASWNTSLVMLLLISPMATFIVFVSSFHSVNPPTSTVKMVQVSSAHAQYLEPNSVIKRQISELSLYI